ncbi:MAG: diguanylate cyclase [Burkholderiales bacterium RIFCSPLOWO2_02_FULL_57_36]|nr:MAG: diguanylate cyclase [Burkholderiales bacterium RIFCSPLOWO2_02_FULL_57_36]
MDPRSTARSDGFPELHINARAAAIASEEALASRERSVEAREDVSHLREETADQRDNAAQGREEALHLRETVATSRESSASNREETLQEADAMKAALEHHIARLREANEHLVITTVQTQIMAEEVQKAKEQMGYMAHHDFLTGLPNRLMLQERLDQAIALAKRHDTKLAVMFMDLDRFKTINDSLGHAVGDKMLQSVSQRLTDAVRSTDTVSHQGGDEFVLLLSEVADENAVAVLATKICKLVSASYFIAGQDLHIGATIGISMYPDDGADAETLIKNADVAMYHAKDDGRGRYHFFRQEMNDRAVERQRTEGDLHRALEQQEFELFYQAQVDLQTHHIIGVEALIRWHHPVRDLLLPAMFVPIAEECGAIIPIGRWVLREACRQMRAWLDDGLMPGTIAVNISAVEFEKAGFFENVRTVLHDTGLAPHHLELELTESVLMENAQSSMAMLRDLKSMGVKIAVDDFGTGYSSLSYLKHFPVDTLKIDQSFVAGIMVDNDDDILVESVISLGKSLRHRVIAEGIETPEQLAFLSDHHCAEGQGFYLSRPMIAENFSALLRSGVSAHLFQRSASLH